MAWRLHVGFKSGAIYIYHAVPPQIARDFFNCSSMGKYVDQKLKGKYPTEGPL